MDYEASEKRQKKLAEQTVKNFFPNTDESFSDYLERLKTNVGHSEWSDYARYYRDAACYTYVNLFDELDPEELGIKPEKKVKQTKKLDEKRLVKRCTGKTYGQIPIPTKVKSTWLSGYLSTNYSSTGYQCSFNGKRVTVVSLSSAHWGYADMSHGEIEVIAAGASSGTTLGFRSLLFDFSEYERGEGTTKDTSFELDQITEQALVAGKTHKYTLTH